jgi:hypothetical protein
MIPTRTNLILFVAITLSTGLITAMEPPCHHVTIENLLTTDVIVSHAIKQYTQKTRRPIVTQQSHIIPSNTTQTLSIPQEEKTHIKVLLSHCCPSSNELSIEKSIEHITIQKETDNKVVILKNMEQISTAWEISNLKPRRKQGKK